MTLLSGPLASFESVLGLHERAWPSFDTTPRTVSLAVLSAEGERRGYSGQRLADFIRSKRAEIIGRPGSCRKRRKRRR